MFPPTAGASAVLPASEALQHLGESVVVEGTVDSVVCSPQACLLSFEAGFSGLVVAIPGDAVAAFPNPDAAYESHRVRVRGTVQDRGGRPRMEVREPGAIQLADGAAATVPAAAPAAKSTPEGDGESLPRKVEVRVEGAPAQGTPLSAREAAAKLGLEAAGVAPRAAAGAEAGGGLDVGAQSELRLLRNDLATLATRLEAIVERLDDLDERLAAVEDFALRIAAARPGNERAPGLPSYIVPGSTSPTMHRVRTGWSAERVLRIMGEPMQVAGNAPGPFTWYYEGGRAVTIDEHGIVVSAIGF